MGNMQNSGIQAEFTEERHERIKESKYPNRDQLVESDLLNEKKLENMERTLNEYSQKLTKPKPNPISSTYKERKEYEINEEVFSRSDQLRFSSLSMQLLGMSKRTIKDVGKFDFIISSPFHLITLRDGKKPNQYQDLRKSNLNLGRLVTG